MLDKSKVKIPEKFNDHPIFNEMIYGTNFGFMAKRGYYLRPEVKRQPEIMKEMGVNWTTLNMNFCQDRYHSTKVYLDFEFSTGEMEIFETVKRLHDNGIKVLFKPCLTPLDGAWMGAVNFPKGLRQIEGVSNDYWAEWFKSFTEAEKYFADLAERASIDSMIIGAEYYGTEGHNEYWEKIIEGIRDNYSQPITYEFTCLSRKSYNLDWIKKLDYLSYSYYPPADDLKVDPLHPDTNPLAAKNPDISVEKMVKYLEPRKARISSICERFNDMPITFTEYGVRSAHGSIMTPHNFLWETYYDGQEQANYMDASFKTFSDLPQWMGLFWWKWDETQERPQYKGDPNGDKGFTIQGKPAEEVFKKWAKK